MNMHDILSKEAIKTKIKAVNKKQLLQDIAILASDIVGIPTMDIAKSLQQREILGPTGMGNGVAIPHVKIGGLTKICGFFSRLESPIDFDSADKQPVDLIFTLLAPENNSGTDHLKALAMVSRMFSNKDIRLKLRAAENTESLFAILTSNEDSKAA
jgi:PTS system nitrogen regulatory IIA component